MQQAATGRLKMFNLEKMTKAQDTKFIAELQKMAGDQQIDNVIYHESEKGLGITVLASELACFRIAYAYKITRKEDDLFVLRGRVGFSKEKKSFFYTH
jgi:hypothetical protein